MTTDKIISWVIQHFKLLSLIGIFILGFAFLSQYTIINVRVEGAGQPTVSLFREGVMIKENAPGISIVAPGRYTVRAKQGNLKETEKSVRFRRFWYNQQTLDLHEQKNAKKLIGNSYGCFYGDASNANQYYSFDCQVKKPLLKHEFIKTPGRETLDVRLHQKGTAYGTGLLSITNDASGENKLVYSSSDGKQTVVRTASSYVGELLLSVVKNENQDKGFVLLDKRTGTLYFYSSVEAEPKQKIVQELANDQSSMVSLSAYDDHIYLQIVSYKPDETRGSKAVDRTDREDTIKSNSVLDFNITNNGSLSEPDRISVNVDRPAFGVKVIDGVHFVGSLGTDNSLQVLEKKGKKMVSSGTLYGALDSVSAGGKLYFNKQNGVYRYETTDRTSQLVYRLDGPNMGVLQSINGQLVFGAVAGNIRYNFVLENSDIKGLHTEKIFRHQTSKSIVNYVDFNESSIVVNLQLESITSDRSSGTTSYDQSEKTQKQNRFIELLKADGIDTEKYQIIFLP